MLVCAGMRPLVPRRMAGCVSVSTCSVLVSQPSETALSRCAPMRSPFLGSLEDVPAGLSVDPTLQSITQRPCILPAQLHEWRFISRGMPGSHPAAVHLPAQHRRLQCRAGPGRCRVEAATPAGCALGHKPLQLR